MRVGEFIEYIRINRGYSRGDLEDICNIKTLYRTERGHSKPKTDLLIKLSRRLNVDLVSYNLKVNMFGSNLSSNEIKELENLDEYKDYKELNVMVLELLSNMNNYSINDIQLLQYYGAKSSYFAHRSYEYSLELIDSALEHSIKKDSKIEVISEYFSTNEIKLFILKSYLYLDNQDYLKAVELLEPIKMKQIDYRNIPIERIKDISKIAYNKALAKYKGNVDVDIEDDLNIAIETCEKFSLFDRLSKFYWLKAKVLYRNGEVKESHKHCDLYLQITRIQGYDDLLEKYIEIFERDFGYKR